MTTTTEKPTSPVVLNPVALLNETVAKKKKEATAQLDRLRRDHHSFAHTSPSIPADAGPAEEARAQAEWSDKRDALRRAERNFSQTLFLMQLDDERGSKKALKDAVTWLRQKFENLQQAKLAAPPATTKSGVAGVIENVLGRRPALEEPSPLPRVHPVVTGPWGSEPMNVAGELAALEREIEQFPEGGQMFTRLVETVNAIASALHQAEPPAPQAVRCDKPFTPKHG